MAASPLSDNLNVNVVTYNANLIPNKGPKLTTKLSSGTFGCIYNTENDKVVAKIIRPLNRDSNYRHLRETNEYEIENLNLMIKNLRSSELVRPHLPFFKDDKTAYKNKLHTFEWQEANGHDGLYVLYMEKVNPLNPKTLSDDCTEAELKFVDGIVSLTTELAAWNYFYLDIKLNNFGQRDSIDQFVLIDLDSLVTYDTRYKQVFTASYLPFEQEKLIPWTPKDQGAYQNVATYWMSVACLVTILQWYSRNQDPNFFGNMLNKYPNYELMEHTKHELCVAIFDRYFKQGTLLDQSKLVKDLVAKVSRQRPFSDKYKSTFEKYGPFYKYRASFTDRTLVF